MSWCPHVVPPNMSLYDTICTYIWCHSGLREIREIFNSSRKIMKDRNAESALFIWYLVDLVYFELWHIDIGYKKRQLAVYPISPAPSSTRRLAGGYTRYLAFKMGHRERKFKRCQGNYWGLADHQSWPRKILLWRGCVISAASRYRSDYLLWSSIDSRNLPGGIGLAVAAHKRRLAARELLREKPGHRCPWSFLWSLAGFGPTGWP